ncbi:MAG: molecular chaperone DnaJ [Alphaproteobacteria bacterium]|nr:molecular chaperone DnaJ [Alphaproteobacteria bacterium]MBN2675160.1 molecular chaperone DnaJ [Alphaproteobacteria bacterium]
MNKSPYEILGVQRDASDADIKKAYHKLVMKYHPDKNSGDKASEEKFKEINNAFDILRDSQKRAAYDRFGDTAFAGGNGAGAGFGGGNPFGNGDFHFNMGGGNGGGMEDILREAMRGFGFDGFGGGEGRASGNARTGRDLLDEVVIDLKDSYFGKKHTVKFSSNVKCEKCGGFGTDDGKQAPVCERCHGAGAVHAQKGFFTVEVPCPDCQGLGRKIKKKCSACEGLGAVHKQRTIDVEIPAGIEDGARLRLAGQGEAGALGAKNGDFYLDIRIRPDKKFTRLGSDLLIKENVPFTTLVLGGEIEIETIDDKKLSVKITAGTQIGEKLRVRGHGMPTVRRSGSFGDLYIEVVMPVPTKLNEKQKKILKDFADSKPDKKSWF